MFFCAPHLSDGLCSPPDLMSQLPVAAFQAAIRLSWPPSCRGQLKCDGTRAETRFRLSAKRTRPFNSAGASVHSTIGSLGVRINGSNAGYTMFRGSVKDTGYPLHSPVSPSRPLPCVTVCHHISTGVPRSGMHGVALLLPHAPSWYGA